MKITSYSAELSWSDSPIETTGEPVTRFRIILKDDNELAATEYRYTDKNKYYVRNLTPFTKYEVSVDSGIINVFGEPTSIMFTSGEDGKFIKKLLQQLKYLKSSLSLALSL